MVAKILSMKKINALLLITLLVLGWSCSAVKEADRKANKNKITTLYPEAVFDSVQAKKAIGYGKATIKGVLFTRQKGAYGIKPLMGGKVYGTNLTVSLFPVTPYFEAWYEMRKSKENKKTFVYMSDAAFRYRIDAKTDEYGRFVFEKMKPGKYFLQAMMSATFARNGQEYTGTGYTPYGNINYYRNKTYYKDQHERMEKFIEVEKDGSVVAVNLR